MELAELVTRYNLVPASSIAARERDTVSAVASKQYEATHIERQFLQGVTLCQMRLQGHPVDEDAPLFLAIFHENLDGLESLPTKAEREAFLAALSEKHGEGMRVFADDYERAQENDDEDDRDISETYYGVLRASYEADVRLELRRRRWIRALTPTVYVRVRECGRPRSREHGRRTTSRSAGGGSSGRSSDDPEPDAALAANLPSRPVVA